MLHFLTKKKQKNVNVWLSFRVFPRAWHRLDINIFILTRLAIGTGCTFSRAWHRLHVSYWIIVLVTVACWIPTKAIKPLLQENLKKGFFFKGKWSSTD